MEKVNILNTRREKVRMFLLKLLRLKETDCRAFLETIVKSDHCKIYVVQRLHEPNHTNVVFKCDLSKEQMVDNLEHNRQLLKMEIDEPEKIGDYFTVFDDKFASLQENIVSEKRTRGKVKEIIKFVNKRLPERYCIFLTALKEMNNDEVFDIMNQPFTNRRQGAERAEIDEQQNPPSVVCSSRGIDPGKLAQLLPVSEETEIHITFENKRLHKLILQNIKKNKTAINIELIGKGALLMKIKDGSIILRLKRIGRLPGDVYKHVTGWLQTVLCNGADNRLSGERFEANLIPVETRDSFPDTHDSYDIVRFNKSFLAEELDANVYIEYLFKKGHFSDEERMSLMQIKSRKGKMTTLLTVILSKPPIAAEDFFNEVEKRADIFLQRHLRPEKIESTLYIANNLMDVFPGVIEILPLRVMTHELQDWPMPDDVQLFLKMEVPRRTKAMAIVQYVLASDETIRCRFVQILRDKDLVPIEVLQRAENHSPRDHTLPGKSGVIKENCFPIGQFHVYRTPKTQRTLQGTIANEIFTAVEGYLIDCLKSIFIGFVRRVKIEFIHMCQYPNQS